MSILVVTEAGHSLALHGERVILSKEGAVIRRMQVRKLRQVVLCAQASLTGNLIHRLLREGCPVLMFDRIGRYLGRLDGFKNNYALVRVRQISELNSKARRLDLARACILAKIRNQRILAMRFQRRHRLSELVVYIERIRQAREGAESAQNLETLRGFEGAAGRAYFEAFAHMILAPDMAMSGRSRRPPRDPVNACLSFGYAILLSVVESAIYRAGLDPMVGALHELERGRPSLVLDLMEEWRPVVVDATVLNLVNKRRLKVDDFENPDRKELAEGVLQGEEDLWSSEEASQFPAIVYCGRVARKVLIQAIYKRLKDRVRHPVCGADSQSIQQVIEFQAMSCRRFVLGEIDAYSGFRST